MLFEKATTFLRLAAIAVVLLLPACSSGAARASHPSTLPATSTPFPSYSEAAAELRPCDLISTSRLSSIVSKPVHIDKIGDVDQRPFVSSGAVLPKVWIATCNWIVGNHTTLAPYLQLELTPNATGAREEFNALRTKMGIPNPVVRIPGYGQQAVFNTDRHGDAVIIILQDSEVITVEVTDTSKHAPSATSRMRMAKAITIIALKQQQL
jgi:hypothetical protein